MGLDLLAFYFEVVHLRLIGQQAVLEAHSWPKYGTAIEERLPGDLDVLC